MKNLMLMTFCFLLMVSSCKCNNGNEAETMTGEMQTTETGENGMNDENVVQQSMDSLTAELRRMFNVKDYTEAEVKEYRRVHDEKDWGDVAGYYPEGSLRVLDTVDIKYLSDWGHSVMLNEIYARHGKIFENEELQQHFNDQNWYHPQKKDVTQELSDIEKQNVEFLKNNKIEHVF